MRPNKVGCRAMVLYRSAAEVHPPPAVDGRILAAARASSHRQPQPAHLLYLGAMAATLMAVFMARWFSADTTYPTAAPEHGLLEGRSRSYLLDFDPLTTGPGGQEGMP